MNVSDRNGYARSNWTDVYIALISIEEMCLLQKASSKFLYKKTEFYSKRNNSDKKEFQNLINYSK